MIDAFYEGICDALYPKKVKGRIINNNPPNWMNKQERMQWMNGFNYLVQQFT